MEDAKPQILLWTVPDCPFRVTVPTTVLNETRIHAVEAFYSVPRGGVEIGGVFFGVREPDAIHIQARRPIRCEYSTGPSFTLSINDQLGLSGLLDEAASDPDLTGLTPLGWYHSHTRSEIFLSPADLQLYNEFFHERWQVALVLRPTNLQATRAGFFFRDRSGNLKSDAPIQEFKLEPPGFGLTLLDPAAPVAIPKKLTVAAPVAAAVPSPAIPAPTQARVALTEPEVAPPVIAPAAKVVSLPFPAPAPMIVPDAPILPPALPPTATLATPANSGAASSLVADASATKVPDVVEARDAKTTESKPAPESKVENPVEKGLRSFDLAESAVLERPRTGWIWALILIILLFAGGATAFYKWARIERPMGLGLETYDINGAFLIRWDRTSTAFRDATGATLEIEDGGEKGEPVTLTPEELAVGGFGYMRRTARVSVRMKVEGPHPMDEFSNFDGVQALGSKAPESTASSNGSAATVEEKEHLRTELINEGMQSLELRREITSLRKQLAEERAKNTSSPGR